VTKLFLSYRRDDSAGHVGRLYDRLVEHFRADEIFVDIDTIEPGQDFIEAIDRAVTAADVLLVIIGKQWLTTTDRQGKRRLDNPHDFVRLEIAAGLKRNIRVIPVLIQGAPIPDTADLPEELRPLTRRNAHEINDKNFHHDVSELIAAIQTRSTPAARAKARVPPKRAAAVTVPPKATSSLTSFPWAIIWSSALILGGAFILLVSIGQSTRMGVSAEVILLVLILAWAVHGVTTEAILYHVRIIRREHQELPWWIKTGCMGLAANGFLLRRASVPAGWGYILIVAVGWLTAFVGGALFVEYVMESVVQNSEWDVLNSTSFSYPGIFFAGFTIGTLGGLVTFAASVLFSRRTFTQTVQVE
jgi:hypothetical protein